MFFKTDAPAGANLYACTATNAWSAQGGITGTNCWADDSSHTLRCQDTSGNVYAVVKTATSGTANQWVDYIGANGTPHTSQPTAGAVGAVADPGGNGVPYRSGAGTATAASADQMSGPFFCQDLGTSSAYSCSLTPAVGGYAAGTTYWFRANTANTGSATLSLNGLGVKPIVKQSNQPLASNDIRAGQWVMVTYDGSNMQMQSQTGNASGSVSAVFGRAGAVTAQTGDYTFAQIGGTASAAQLPTVAMRTDQGNAVTAGTQDFSQSAHTLPMKSGSSAAMPSTCSVGETYFATDATAGNNLYGCTASNVWSQQAGSVYTVKASGTVVGLRNVLNIIPGLGMAPIVTDTGSQINVQLPIDTAVTETRLNEASGADLLVMPSSNSGTAYAGCPSGVTPPLTTGMVVHLTPDHSSTGGATTFNYCSTSAGALKEADGTSNLTSTDLIAGRQQDIWYDGTEWRLKGSSGSGSGGSMTWPSSAGVTVYGGSAAWGSSLSVGTSANNLVQLNGSGQLPAVSAALLTTFPTLNQSTTGNAATATALTSAPSTCSAGQYSTGINASGTAQGCTALAAVATSGSASDLGTGTLPHGRLPALQSGDIPNNAANTSGNAATATSIAGGAVGALHYQSAAATTAFLSGNTAATDQVVVSHGTGSAAQAPTLTNAPALSAANMSSFPALNQNTTGTAAGLTAQYIDWSASSGGASIANKPAFSDMPAFVICTTTGCLPEATFNNYFISAPSGVTFDECGVSLATMPTVQNVIIDIQTAAGVSIFGTTKLVVATTDAAGTTKFQATFSSSPYTAAKGAQFKAVVTQSDTGGAALGGYVKCRVH
jgi:hypothetical protein